MTSKIKAISLAAFAIMALSMIGASAAQASLSELHATNTPGKADVIGEQVTQNVLTLTNSGAKLVCIQALFEGTVSDGGSGPQTTASEVTLTPQDTGCELTNPVGAAAEVKMNGCKYTITGSTTALTANVDITGCTSGKKIEIIGGGCTVTVGEQGPLSHIVFVNQGSGETQDVNAEFTVQGMQYQTEGLFCILGAATRSDGDYTGTVTLTGRKDTGATNQVTHNGHQFSRLIVGEQVGLFASAAQSSPGALHVTNTLGKAVITGQQVTQHVFTLTNSGTTTKCTQVLFEGTVSDGGTGPQTTASEVTLTPQYTGCEITSPVNAAAEVKVNGCKYTITGGTTALTAQVDIAGCTSGKSIEIIGGGCTVTVPVQAAIAGHVVFANAGSGETQDVTAQITMQGIQYTTEGLFCILGQAQRSDGDYTGTATFKAFVDPGTSVQTTHNGHQFEKLNIGEERGLFAT